MNLHTTLKAYNEANVQHEQELIINEAKAIIQQSEKSDLDILTALGMDRNIIQFKKIEREIEQSTGFEEIYDISVIRKMAIHYKLRFLPSNIYTGTIDPLLPSILNSFILKHRIAVNEPSKNNKQFYILAPASSFELQAVPKDPIIFYKINANKYAFIHKWGNDLNRWRKVKSWISRSTGHACLTFAIILSIPIFVLFLLTNNPEALMGYVLLGVAMMIIPEYEFSDTKWDSINL